MRIAFYYNLAFGGAKRVVMEHVKGLKSKGHSVDLYTLNSEKDAFDPSMYADNVFNYAFSLGSQTPVFNRFISDYHNFFTLKKFLWDEQVQ